MRIVTLAESIRQLRSYRPPSADPAQPREHHPICDRAADIIEFIARHTGLDLATFTTVIPADAAAAADAEPDDGLAQLDTLLPPPDFPGGFIIADGQRKRFRVLNEWGGPDWTHERADALRFARRVDAKAFCREDEDAWFIVPLYLPHPELVQALKAAVEHMVHMATWISDHQAQAPGYSFEPYGEDIEGLKAALDKASAL